jgi:hypothetical protein
MSDAKVFLIVRHDGSRESVKADRFKLSDSGYLDFFAGEKIVAVAAPGWSVVAEQAAMP